MDLKITTFNAEWMVSFFKANEPVILSSYDGGSHGPIKREAIDDVKALCRRIGTMLKRINPDVLTIVEGPPHKDQMEAFVAEYLDDGYGVFSHDGTDQNIHLLVRKGLGQIRQSAWDSPLTLLLRKSFYYYPWGEYTEEKMKKSRVARVPAVIELDISGKSIVFMGVHTKSKISKLREPSQWYVRDKEAVLDALNSRQKLSAEVRHIREALDDLLKESHGTRGLAVMGDFNDGPFSDIMEAEFLVHNIIDEIQGSLLNPGLRLFHTMSTETIMSSHSTVFDDPFSGGAPVKELIDHILVSRGIAEGAGGVAVKPGTAMVEEEAYQANCAEIPPERKRELRPSDHLPVSVTLEV